MPMLCLASYFTHWKYILHAMAGNEIVENHMYATDSALVRNLQVPLQIS